MKKHLAITSLLAALLLPPAFGATRTWVGGNGVDLAWGTSTNWSSSTPPSLPDDSALFFKGANLSVLVPDGSSTTGLVTQENTNVTLKLAAPVSPSTATLTVTGFLDVANSSTAPLSSASSLVTVTGSGGVLHSNAIRVGVQGSLGGNTLTFTDRVRVTSELSNTISIIGRTGTNNLLKVEAGADVTVGNLSIGSEKGVANNRLEITGSNSRFTIGSAGSNRGLRVGMAAAGTSYADAMQENYVHVSDGGRLVVTTLSAGSGNSIIVGSQTSAHDNYILIEGKDSVFELGKGAATSGGGTTIRIGDDTALNLGGNYVEIRDGASLISGDAHTGTITIYGHDRTNPSAVTSNRLTVGDDGTVSLGGAINVTGGLLQLSKDGSLTAASVTVGAEGRFEAAGGGFKTTGVGKTTVQNLGTLAVQDQSLSLQTGVTLANGSTLELHLLDDETVGGIEFLSGGTLSIGATTKLSLVADDPGALQLGGSWQIFTGDTLNGLTGAFNLDLAVLPTLQGSLEWDFTAFNEAGGWTVTVIPEPGSIALVGAGIALLAGRALTRKKSTSVS